MGNKTEFPKWNPNRNTLRLLNENPIHSRDPDFKRKQYRALRNSSNAFISRPDVRLFIFSKYQNSCLKCDAKERLQIDHVISIADCIAGKIHFSSVNDEINLVCLCITCNSSKTHFT